MRARALTAIEETVEHGLTDAARQRATELAQANPGIARHILLTGSEAYRSAFEQILRHGPEMGLAWYEKGRFYLDARDGFSRSGAAWRNFLALAPSGPRAARAKDTLGVR